MAANATIAIDPDLDIRHRRFNQILKLPEDPNQGRHKPFTLKYADYGYRNEKNPEQENVLLLFGPLLGSRLVHTAKHELAKQHKVRLINPDRFGIGGTDETKAEMRLEVWRGKSYVYIQMAFASAIEMIRSEYGIQDKTKLIQY